MIDFFFAIGRYSSGNKKVSVLLPYPVAVPKHNFNSLSVKKLMLRKQQLIQIHVSTVCLLICCASLQ